MADIFISYTSADRDWAFWIGQELEKLGHTPRIDAWEIPGGGDIASWMEERHQNADHILCAISTVYLTKPYSSWERRSAQWAAQTGRPNFALPVRIEDCQLPTLLASVKCCDLFGVEEEEARARLASFLAPAGKPLDLTRFPGGAKPATAKLGRQGSIAFPGNAMDRNSPAFSNIQIVVPRHFLGREAELAAIDSALGDHSGRTATAVLYGLRGVGKTTLAAAYAEWRRGEFRVTWWIRAETEATMRADLVELGVRLDWVVPTEKEEIAFATVIERLRHHGEGILLVYDNATGADIIGKFLPRGSKARIIITSNAPTQFRRVAAPVKIEVWPKEVGATYLIERTGRSDERTGALLLSDALGGLPLALEQAAAYCDDLGITLSEYQHRFEAATMQFLRDASYMPSEYHPEHAVEHKDRLTVAGTFSLAIETATQRDPDALPWIVHAALLAPEPIPLFLFLEGGQQLGEPFRAATANAGPDKAIAALRAVALVDREVIPDERDPTITTDCIRLHRLVRQVAAARPDPATANDIRRRLITALAAVYPAGVLDDPQTWPRARRLDALVLELVSSDSAYSKGAEAETSYLLDRLAFFRQGSLAAYAQARPLFDRALAIRERSLGPDHPDTAKSLNNLGDLLNAQGDLKRAQTYYERALEIRERTLGPDHLDIAESLSGIGYQRQARGDFQGAQSYYKRALDIREKWLGPRHPDIALSLNNLGYLARAQQKHSTARAYYQRALDIRKDALGSDHPSTALSLNNLGFVKQLQNDLVGARQDCEQAVQIYQKTLGPDHPATARSHDNLGIVLRKQGKLAEALAECRRGLVISEKVLGIAHPDTLASARNTLNALNALGRTGEAKELRDRYGLEDPWFLRIRKRLLASLH